MQQIWIWFLELNGARQYTEHGGLPLTYTEIKAWAEMMDSDVTPQDVQVLKQLDRIALSTK